MTLLVAAAVVLLAVEDLATAMRMSDVLPQMQVIRPALLELALPWAPWLLLAPGIAFLGWRFIPGRIRWWWALVAHVAAAAVAPWLVSELQGMALAMWLEGSPERMPWPGEASGSIGVVTMLPDGTSAPIEVADGAEAAAFADTAYWWYYLHEVSRWLGLCAVAVVPSLALLSGERERLRDQIARELAETETRMLRGQLQPHFLFNALNGIQVLIDEDPDRAKVYLRRLSDLLRNTLEDAHLPILPLARELEILADYLAIERLRFGERVQFEVQVAPGLDAVPVLSFMVQPLIENSLVHGPGSVPGVGCIRVRVAKSGSQLEVSVTDDGPGASRSGVKMGRGLGVLERRLSRHFGERAELSLESPETGGFSVTVRLPIDEVPES